MASREELESALREADWRAQGGDQQAAADARRLADALHAMGTAPPAAAPPPPPADPEQLREARQWAGTIRDPLLWNSLRRAGQGAADLARDVPNTDWGKVARDTGETVQRDWNKFWQNPVENTGNFLAAIPGAVAQPFQDLLTTRQQVEALDRGDLAGAQALVDRQAGAAPLVAATGAGAGPALSTPLRAAGVAGGITFPYSVAAGEGSLQERLPRALAQTGEAAAIGGGSQFALNAAGRAVRGVQGPQPDPAVLAREREFSQLSSGERTRDPGQMLREDDFRRGKGSDQVQPIMGSFDDARARQLDTSAMRLASRGRAPLSEDVGHAGNIIATEYRNRAQRAFEQRGELYDQTMQMARDLPPVAPSDELLSRVDDAINRAVLANDPAAQGARAVVEELSGYVRAGKATHEVIEAARKRLNRALGPALRGGQDADVFAIQTVLRELDDWQVGQLHALDGDLPARIGAVRPPRGQAISQAQARQMLAGLGVPLGARTPGGLTASGVTRFRDAVNRGRPDAELAALVGPGHRAARALQEARGLYHETSNQLGRNVRPELGTGHTGRIDLGARSADKVLNAELSDEAVVNEILGRASPTQSSLPMVQRIRQANDAIIYSAPDAASGARLPGRRKVGGRTRGEQRFASNAEPLIPELQALREALFHKIFGRMRQPGQGGGDLARRRGEPIPWEAIERDLRTALYGSRRQITEQMFNADEIATMKRLHEHVQDHIPPPGRAFSGTDAGLLRLLGDLGRLTGVPWLLQVLLGENLTRNVATMGARSATRPPRSTRPRARLPQLGYPPAAAAVVWERDENGRPRQVVR